MSYSLIHGAYGPFSIRILDKDGRVKYFLQMKAVNQETGIREPVGFKAGIGVNFYFDIINFVVLTFWVIK